MFYGRTRQSISVGQTSVVDYRRIAVYYSAKRRANVYANANYLTLHSSQTGKKKLRFPYPVTLYEVYEQKTYATSVTEYTVDTYLGETKTFRMIKE